MDCTNTPVVLVSIAFKYVRVGVKSKCTLRPLAPWVKTGIYQVGSRRPCNEYKCTLKNTKINSLSVSLCWRGWNRNSLYFVRNFVNIYNFKSNLKSHSGAQVEKVICLIHGWASNESTLRVPAIICVNKAAPILHCASQSDCHCRGVKDPIKFFLHATVWGVTLKRLPCSLQSEPNLTSTLNLLSVM